MLEIQAALRFLSGAGNLLGNTGPTLFLAWEGVGVKMASTPLLSFCCSLAWERAV